MKSKFYELQFEIETSCLLDCVHCSSANSHREERAYSDEAILDFLQLFSGHVHIYFTGGEPLLYADLSCLCERIHAAKPDTDIGIYSTGNCSGFQPISTELAQSLKHAGVCDCYFSIYSNNQEEHDQWTNHAGSFQNTLDSIRRFSTAGILPKAHLILTRENQRKLSEVICFCQEIGLVKVRILRLAPSGNAKINWDNIGIPLEAQNDYIRRLIQEREDYPIRLTFAGYPTLHPCRAFPDAQKCQAGTNLLYIDASGDIYPCACTKQDAAKYKICNIREIDILRKHLEYLSKKNCYPTCFNRK